MMDIDYVMRLSRTVILLLKFYNVEQYIEASASCAEERVLTTRILRSFILSTVTSIYVFAISCSRFSLAPRGRPGDCVHVVRGGD